MASTDGIAIIPLILGAALGGCAGDDGSTMPAPPPDAARPAIHDMAVSPSAVFIGLWDWKGVTETRTCPGQPAKVGADIGAYRFDEGRSASEIIEVYNRKCELRFTVAGQTARLIAPQSCSLETADALDQPLGDTMEYSAITVTVGRDGKNASLRIESSSSGHGLRCSYVGEGSMQKID